MEAAESDFWLDSARFVSSAQHESGLPFGFPVKRIKGALKKRHSQAAWRFYVRGLVNI